MPADDGLGPDEHEVAPPVAAEAAGEDPQQLVAEVNRGALAGRAGQDGQLVAQQKSLMPELLLRDLTAEQAADLLEFLASLK